MVLGLRSIRNYATEEKASSHHEAKSPPVQPIPPIQATPLIQPAPIAQLQTDVVCQLLPTLVAILEALLRLAGNQTNQVSISTPAPPAVELLLEASLSHNDLHEPVQGITLANDDNQSTA